ncbi:MAG: VWA domain-containing protein [Acidobacteria bacterium]|nr:VWA domain-containing protein [Acidobacteriota bacterium]
MKYRNLYVLIITVLVAFAFSSLPSSRAYQAQKPTDPKAKDDKSKNNSNAEPPQDDQVIKLGAQLVTVPFNVTDKQNRFINDLSKEDIELFEDNKPQEIFSFERQTDMALTIAMLIDISGSQEYTLPEEVMAGKRFFEKVLRKKDLGAVITFEHDSVLVQDLTSNIERLKHALDEVRVPIMTAVIPGRTGTPPINGGSNVGSTAMFDSIYSASADLLSKEAGRRVIILVTDGDDNSSHIKMREAIERTWRNEIIIYSIGIGGPYGINQGDLKKLAAETGGRAFFPHGSQDLEKAYNQIEEDLRSQNILAYQSTNEVHDGSFRTIQVRIKNRKDLTVRHRRGYFAPKEGV